MNVIDDGVNEAELARQARDGDPEALSALLERLRVPLFAAALAALRHYHDAQDAVAEVLVQVCRHVDDLREPGRVRSWAGAIMRNEIRRWHERCLESPAGETEFAEPSTEAGFS